VDAGASHPLDSQSSLHAVNEGHRLEGIGDVTGGAPAASTTRRSSKGRIVDIGLIPPPGVVQAPPSHVAPAASTSSKSLTDSSGSQPVPIRRRDTSMKRDGVRPSNLAAPAPPVVSVTPVSRVRNRESPTAPDGSGGRARHIRTSSVTSNSRPRRGSFSGLSLASPSTSSLSAFAVDQLDYTNIPGFPIADDARSLRTVASARQNDSVSKIIRRLRGEGLRWVGMCLDRRIKLTCTRLVTRPASNIGWLMRIARSAMIAKL
jgi:1-phosphatidylinositol-3-phosphate 5-kinase